MTPFPPGQGGGEGVAHARKGKGIRIHSLKDASGMPLSTHTTPANGEERAQIFPVPDALHVRAGQRGRPRERLKVLAADKIYEAKDLRLRNRAIHPQIPKRVWNHRKPRGAPHETGRPALPSLLVVRWERLVACFNAFLALAMIHIGVQRLIVG
jgi:hypothetical protein